MRITTLNHNLDTSKVTNMSSMFKGIQVNRLDLSSFDTSNVIDMSHMFQELSTPNKVQNDNRDILTLNITNFNYDKVTDMSYMFAYRRHYKLTQYKFQQTLLGNNFDETIHGLNLSCMFGYPNVTYHNANYEAIEENFSPIIKTDRAINCQNMFIGSLHKKIDLYDCVFTKNVRTMNYMFMNCGKAQQIDICSFTSNKLQSCKSMFSTCSNLQAIRASFNFRPDLIADSSLGLNDPTNDMFKNCLSLGLGQVKGSDVYKYDSTKVNGQMAKLHMFETPGYFCGQIIYFINSQNYNYGYFVAGWTDRKKSSNSVSIGADRLTLQPQYLGDYHAYSTHYLSSQLTGKNIVVYKINSNLDKPIAIQTINNMLIINFRSPNIVFGVIYCRDILRKKIYYKAPGYTTSTYVETTPNIVWSFAGTVRDNYGLCRSITNIKFQNPYTTNQEEGHSYIQNTQYKINKYTANISQIFRYCNSLTSLDVTNFDTSNVTDMRFMFDECRSLTSLNVTNFDTSNVTDMNSMFNDCRSLISLDVSNFNTSNVINMSEMFWNCNLLISLDVINFNTSNVINMSEMFANCSSLTRLDLSNFNTSNVTNMSGMFFYCSSLTLLDLFNFNTSSITDMSNMFFYCRKLKYIIVSTNFNVINVSSSSRMFGFCDVITGSKGTTYNSSKTDKEYARIDNAPSTPGYFWSKEQYEDYMSSVVMSKSKMKSQIPTTATKISILTKQQIPTTAYTSIKQSGGGDIWVTNNGTEYIICTNKDQIYLPNYSYQLFLNYNKLILLDLSNFNTSKVTNMNSMFTNCESLTTLDLSNFNTSKVTNMNSMFTGCSKLATLNLSNFNTSNVTNMQKMFKNCELLTSLNISNFNTSNVINMDQMFNYCESLTTLDMSNFNTSNVTNMSYMFYGCYALTALDLSNFNTSNVTNMSYMFSYCNSLISLNLSNFNTSNVTDMSKIFSQCNSLKYIIASANFYTSQATSSIEMFYQCRNIIGSKGTTYNYLKTDKEYARIDNAPTVPGYFWSKQQYEDFITPVVLSKSKMETAIPRTSATKISVLIKQTIPSTYNSIKESGGGDIWVTNNGTEYTINTNKDQIYLPVSCYRLFYDYNELTSLDVSNFNTSNVTNMREMFYSCDSLTSLDLSNFNTSNVTNMFQMFSACRSLTSLDITNFNTSSVTEMGGMFYDCRLLTSLDVTNFNTSSVTGMDGMFQRCYSLTTLDLSNFNTSNMIYTQLMFNDCSSLKYIIVSANFDISEISNSYQMFNYSNNIIGSKGTTYDSTKVDKTYARIDNAPTAPGYFWSKAQWIAAGSPTT